MTDYACGEEKCDTHVAVVVSDAEVTVVDPELVVVVVSVTVLLDVGNPVSSSHDEIELRQRT